ncbi:tetratricopeptide repeat protein [Candidatus Magnetomonas plexicatena]|uniref:tetratricopeptide repeat protein n=1 Tax=Candidatus Magnetomonas plexicatena TaxID=2552947 RepID=UPI001C779F60|nr:tetratricopeptide repeat protein [Nitrospirales bacterium LBB_01]
MADYKCQRCSSAMNLNGHHISYPDNFEDDNVDNIVILCKNCHEIIHEKNIQYKTNKKYKYHANAQIKTNRKFDNSSTSKEAEAYFNSGFLHYKNGDHEQAITDYTKGIELDPNSASAYNNLGSSYNNKGEYDRAIADYNRAIELNPHLTEAYNNRGNSYKNKGDYYNAIDDYSTAARLGYIDAQSFLQSQGIKW